jgi:hypothetical protein
MSLEFYRDTMGNDSVSQFFKDNHTRSHAAISSALGLSSKTSLIGGVW